MPGDRRRCQAAGWVDKPHEFPAPWVERHLDRLGGWRLAPQLLVDQLAVLEDSAPLVLVPRRQIRHPKSQLDFLGEAVDVILHPDDRPLPVWSTVRRWSFAARMRRPGGQ